MNENLARASQLLGGSMPPLHGPLRLTALATPEATAALDAHERQMVEALRRGPRTAVELLADAGWTVDAAGAISRLTDRGFLAVEPVVPRKAFALAVYLAFAFAGAAIVVASLPSFWRGRPIAAFAGLLILVMASGGALATAIRKPR